MKEERQFLKIVGIISSIVLILASIASLILNIFRITRLFLPILTEILFPVIGIIVSLSVLVIFSIVLNKNMKGFKNAKNNKRQQSAEASKLEMLHKQATSFQEAIQMIHIYLSLENTFLLGELQTIVATLRSIDKTFISTTEALRRRFTGGYTMERFQDGISSLAGAALSRLNTQMLQLCAVNENDLRKKAITSSECAESLNKLTSYVRDTSDFLDKIVGLMTKLVIEVIDCSEDTLIKETEKIVRLTSELENYKGI